MAFARIICIAISLILTGCATQYQKDAETKAQSNPITEYKRSKPESVPPGPLYSFISVESEQVEVTYKPSMPFLQSRTQCDVQPFESYFQQPTSQRRCVQAINNNCVAYQERFRGEPQPACLKTALLNNNCILREDPNQPTLKYRTRQDCYQTPATSEVVGQFQVLAVPEGTRPGQIKSSGRALGTLSVTKPGEQAKLRLSERPKPSECLAIVDAGELVLAVRSNAGGQDPYLFATPQMRAEKTAALLQKQAEEDQQYVQRLRSQRDEQRTTVVKNVAWKTDRCVMPTARAIPAQPTILPEPEIKANARGVCFIALAGQFSLKQVTEAINASQDFEYLRDSQRFQTDPSKIAQCALRVYRYGEGDLAVLRGERGKKEYTDAPDFFTGIIGLYSGAIRDSTTTRSEKLNMVTSMLSSCSRAVENSCRLPMSNWEQEVRNIKIEPEMAMKKCTGDVDLWQRFNEQIKEAEQKAVLSLAKLRAARPAPDVTRKDAGDLVCKADGL